MAPVLKILGVPRLPPGGSLGTGKRGTVPKLWLAVPNFLARINEVLILKRSIVEKRIVQSGWDPKNGRSKLIHNVSNFCYFHLYWCDQGKIPWQTSLSQRVSLELSIVESL